MLTIRRTIATKKIIFGINLINVNKNNEMFYRKTIFNKKN